MTATLESLRHQKFILAWINFLLCWMNSRPGFVCSERVACLCSPVVCLVTDGGPWGCWGIVVGVVQCIVQGLQSITKTHGTLSELLH